MMSTSFSTSPKEWDSDGDEDSSEEFMYVKGGASDAAESTEKVAKLNETTTGKSNAALAFEVASAGDSTTITESEVWNAHTDQVMVSTSPTASELSEGRFL